MRALARSDDQRARAAESAQARGPRFETGKRGPVGGVGVARATAGTGHPQPLSEGVYEAPGLDRQRLANVTRERRLSPR